MRIETFSERLRDAARVSRFRMGSYGTIGETALPVLERHQADDAPAVYISTGVHGNEPAGPMAVLDLLQKRLFPESLNLVIFPMINPAGLAAGTRENAGGIDLNRDYGFQPRAAETRAQLEWIGTRQFDFVICLHEDDDGEGFYIYSHVEAETRHDYPGLALEAARPWTGIDSRVCIDDMPADNGRMMPPSEVLDRKRPDLPEALRLHFHHGPKFTFTTETPSRQPAANRIAAQVAVVRVLLETFASEWPLAPR